MTLPQGDLSLLNDPVALELLCSQIPARLAYVWPDGSPRVVPIWFHWNGEQVVMASPPVAPKVSALLQNPKVALTIDSEGCSPKVLMIRGTAAVEFVGEAPEYAAAAMRYLGEERGSAWANQAGAILPQWARISVTPEWVGILDFEQRLPSALARAMAEAAVG